MNLAANWIFDVAAPLSGAPILPPPGVGAYARQVSRCLTSLVPQPRHKHPEWLQTPWSEGFDRIFRNEGVTGSNPVSSTEFAL